MNQALWETEFPPPMPEGMTYNLFHALRSRKDQEESIEDTANFINELKKLPDSEAKKEWIKMEMDLLSSLRRR